MALRLVPLAVSTFGEIAALELEVHVWCQRCKQQRPVPLNSPALYARVFAGSRFRCTRTLWDGKVCNGAGHPTIRPATLLPTDQDTGLADIYCDRCVPPWRAGRSQARALGTTGRMCPTSRTVEGRQTPVDSSDRPVDRSRGA